MNFTEWENQDSLDACTHSWIRRGDYSNCFCRWCFIKFAEQGSIKELGGSSLKEINTKELGGKTEQDNTKELGGSSLKEINTKELGGSFTQGSIKELGGSLEGWEEIKKIRGQSYRYWRWRENGVKKSKYLGKVQ